MPEGADASALGIDSGGTATRWALVATGGAIVATGSVAPLTGHVFSEADRAEALQALDALRAAVLPNGKPSRVLAGVTGLGAVSRVADFLRAAFSERFALPPASIKLVDDMWLAYRAHFAPGDGIVVSAGTGSIAYHLTTGGEIVRAGGYGILVDDGGSGAWIGVRALRHVLRLEDESPGTGWNSMLGQCIGAVLGGASWDAARIFVYGGKRAGLGALARAVAEAAAQGDVIAADIFVDAGAELARLATALRQRVGMLPVSLIGRAATLDHRIAESFTRLAEPPLAVETEPRDAAAIAARIALEDR